MQKFGFSELYIRKILKPYLNDNRPKTSPSLTVLPSAQASGEESELAKCVMALRQSHLASRQVGDELDAAADRLDVAPHDICYWNIEPKAPVAIELPPPLD